MTRLDDLAAARFAAVAFQDRTISNLALNLWDGLDLRDAQESFEADILPPLLAATIQTQQSAAEVGGLYANRVATAQDIPAGPRIRPEAFSGVSSSGGSLIKALSMPLVRTYTAAAAGATESVARAVGAEHLDEVVTTQVQDAARAAELTSLAANADVAGYLRITEPGACSRCIVLAGKFYRWNSGFRRHPRCRCHHELRRVDTEPQDPREVFDGMSSDEQDRIFTAAGAESIRQGADISQVVNVRSGMSTATVAGQKVQVTTQGVGPRSFTTSIRRRIAEERGGRFRRQPRLMPEEIIRQAGSDRDLARRLLISNGYIVGDIGSLAREVATAGSR